MAEEDDVFMNWDPDRTYESFSGSDLEDEDDEQIGNWRDADRDPESWDECDADGEQATAHAFLVCCEVRGALWAQNETIHRKSPFTSPSVVWTRERMALLGEGMSKKSTTWPKG